MNKLYTLVYLLIAIFNFVLGFVVMIRNPKGVVNRLFLGFILSVMGWIMSIYFIYFYMFSESAPLTVIGRTNFLTGGLAVYYLFLLSYNFPRVIFRLKPVFIKLITLETFVISVVTMFTPLIDKRESLVGNTLVTTYGSLYIWFIFHFLGLMVASLVILYVKYRGSTKLEKQQLKLLFLGMTLGTVFAAITNLFVPLIFGYYDLQFFGPLGTVFMVATVGYAIIRHRLMDIRLVIVRAVAYLILVAVLGLIYAVGIFAVSSLLTGVRMSPSNFVVSTFLALVIAFSYSPLLRSIEGITNRLFYKGRYDMNKLLHELLLIMASKLRLHDLTNDLLSKILSTIRISRGAFILIDSGRVVHIQSQDFKNELDLNDDALKVLIGCREMVIFDELAECPLKDFMRELDISVILPLRSKTETEDVLIFGEKLSGDVYTDYDVKFFEIFAPSAAIAIENSESVEKLIQLDEAKSEFITVVSHQMRTPLSVARWDFELLIEGSIEGVTGDAKQTILNIYKSLMILNNGLNIMMMDLEVEEGKAILNTSRVNFGKDVVEPAIKELEAKISEKKITLENNVDPEVNALLDGRKIGLVVDVLVGNAVNYSNPDSKVTVYSKLDGGVLQFSVEDEGIGVNPKDKNAIFKRFYRGEEAKKIAPNGFGLGLFISRAYVEMHGGKLWLEPRDKGTRFCFEIPVQQT